VETRSLKKCSKCGEEKSLSEFYKHKEGKFGTRPECKDCSKEVDKIKNKRWRTVNAERNKLKNQNFYLNNPDYNKDYYKEHTEEIKQTVKEYVEKNKEKIVQYQKEYHATHPTIIDLEKSR